MCVVPWEPGFARVEMQVVPWGSCKCVITAFGNYRDTDSAPGVRNVNCIDSSIGRVENKKRSGAFPKGPDPYIKRT